MSSIDPDIVFSPGIACSGIGVPEALCLSIIPPVIPIFIDTACRQCAVCPFGKRISADIKSELSLLQVCSGTVLCALKAFIIPA